MTRAKKTLALSALSAFAAGIIAAAGASALAAQQTDSHDGSQVSITVTNRHGASEPGDGPQQGNRHGA
ncbi:MAG: hypothetical protein ACRDQF_10755 [Thermocrispum sp.]